MNYRKGRKSEFLPLIELGLKDCVGNLNAELLYKLAFYIVVDRKRKKLLLSPQL